MIPTSPPASPTFLTFSVKLQPPRSIRTILPASDPAANAAQPFRLPPARHHIGAVPKSRRRVAPTMAERQPELQATDLNELKLGRGNLGLSNRQRGRSR